MNAIDLYLYRYAPEKVENEEHLKSIMHSAEEMIKFAEDFHSVRLNQVKNMSSIHWSVEVTYTNGYVSEIEVYSQKEIDKLLKDVKNVKSVTVRLVDDDVDS